MTTAESARMLGWASIGLGLAELLAPRAIERQLGVSGHAELLRLMGLREIASGVAILSQRNATPAMAAGLWSRVVGDAIDLGLLAAAARESRNPAGLAAATAMVLGISALDVVCAAKLHEEASEPEPLEFASWPPDDRPAIADPRASTATDRMFAR